MPYLDQDMDVSLKEVSPMHALTKKTTILFAPDLYHQLETLAEASKTSVANLIRQAVVQQYFLVNRKRRLAAAQAMGKLNLPVADWQTMEQEAVRGRLSG